MNNINYVVTIVKILEIPTITNIEIGTSSVQFRAQFWQIFQSSIVIRVSVNEYLANDLIKHYKVNDYILVEGYLSIRKLKNNLVRKNMDYLQLNAYKIFLLS